MGGRGSGSGIGGFKDWLKGTGAGKGKARPMDLKKFDGMSLQQIEGRLRGLKHEELFVLDKNGKVVGAYKGGPTSVAFPMSTLYEKGATVTHGHPKGAEEFGGTFSFADMKNMLNSGWAEHRATASGKGEMNYILRRTGKSNSKGFYNRINKDYANLNSKIVTAYKNAYNKAKKSGVSRTSAIHQARQTGVGVLNRYYKETAPKYGFEYVTRKENYKYNR